jgi:hypothetical protein
VSTPLPTRLSPIAGFANALRLHYIRLASAAITDLQRELAALIDQQQHLKGDRP